MGILYSQLAKPGTFSEEDVSDASFSRRIGRVVRFLVKSDGCSRVQRPQARSGRRCHDYDFYFTDKHACGIVLYSRHHPGHKALGNGWFVSDRDLDRLQAGLIGGHSYCHIVYLFGSGDIHQVNANIALAAGNCYDQPLVPIGTRTAISGVHIQPIAFRHVGSLLDPTFGDGGGPVEGND